MKAIPTHYMGYEFRSRLEARWAVFFEALQLDWRYEVEGYSLPSGPYLPDFLMQLWGPDGNSIWVEIKPPGDPSPDEVRAVADLAAQTGSGAYLVSGDPWPWKFSWVLAEPGTGEVSGPTDDNVASGGVPRRWLECERDRDMGFGAGVSIGEAFKRARSARFEHGESPGLPVGWEGVRPAGAGRYEGAAIEHFWDGILVREDIA